MGNDSELKKLKRFLTAIDEQDSLIYEAMKRSRGPAEVNMDQYRVMKKIFEEVNAGYPELLPKFEFNGRPDANRSQLRYARHKLNEKIDELREEGVISTTQNVDKRRLFVIHGRNLKIRDSMFSFLRAIDLDPIEWEQAIAMTGQASPYIGEILEAAFSNAQAALVLLTGDDLARLGTRYLKEDGDKIHERQFTPQARPNVLFEAGLALASHPKRTIIVEIGNTRPFSDILGRHVISFSNVTADRLKLANRLRGAGCAVNIDNREGWLTAGDFAIPSDPDLNPDERAAEGEIQKRNEQIAELRADCANLTKENKLLNQWWEIARGDLIAEKDRCEGLQKQIEQLQNAENIPTSTLNPLPLRPEDLANMPPNMTQVSFDLGMSKAILRCHSSASRKGIILNITNETNTPFAGCSITVTKAHTLDSVLMEFRPTKLYGSGELKESFPLDPSWKSDSMWVVHTTSPSKLFMGMSLLRLR